LDNREKSTTTTGSRSAPARIKKWLGDGTTLGLSKPPRWSLLGWFLAADALLIVAHVINAATFKQDFLRINLEFSLGESFQYAKFLTIAVVMVLLYRQSRRMGPALWGLVFAYLAVDDAFALHEAFGRALARWWGVAEEAAVSQVGAGFTLGLAIGAIVVAAYYAGGLRRRVTAVLVVGLVGLGFFGVGVDFIHGLEVVSENRFLNIAVRIVEEGGEMLVASFLVAFALMVGIDTSEIAVGRRRRLTG
jgi:hypothetical protein